MKFKNLIVVFAVLLTMALVPTVAYATSAYDSLVEPTETALIGGGTCSSTEDITRNWYAVVNDSSLPYGGGSGARTSVLSALTTARINGVGWSLIQQTSYDTNILHYVSVVVTPSANAATFNTYTGYPGNHDYLKVANSMTIDIYKDGYDDCKTKLYFSSSSTDRILAQQFDIAHCYGGFCDERQPVFVNNEVDDLGGSYGGATIPDEVPNAKYVAMGDSFSSGEGNPPFEAGSDTGSNTCHRSSKAFPRLIQEDLGFISTAFVACSGATTADITSDTSDASDNWYEGPQVNALSEDTEIVTITIGGNDIKFKELAAACVYTNCSSNSSEYEESWDIMSDSNRNDYLPDRLGSVFSGIANGLTSNNTFAKVYVIGYPYVVTENAWTSTTSSDPWNCLYLSQSSAAGAETVIDKLNQVIDESVTDFNDSRFEYVDPTTYESPFLNHELCTNGGYFNGIESASPPNGQEEYIFHPNENGQDAYKELVGGYIN